MPTPATYDDVNLILRLYETRREPRLRQARQWFLSNCRPKNRAELLELCPMGSEENASFRMVVTYWEMAASFVVSGVLNEDLFFESAREMLLVWERVKPVAAEQRSAFKDPNVWKNLEIASERYVQKWKQKSGPGAYETFAEFIKTFKLPEPAESAKA